MRTGIQRSARIIVIGLCTCLLSAQAMAKTSEFLLDNGLKLIVREDHRAPIVVSQVWYKVGSSYEHDGITGLSHVLEHMMFKGTKKHPAGEFSRIISENGGSENAFTGSDYTAYFQTLEKSRLPISFELEADRMQGLLIPAEEFAKEIEVVKEERRMRTEDNPESYTYEVAMATAFQNSPYRHPIIGWMSDLESMTVDSLQDWYRNWYAPDNATIVVAGDVDAEAVHQLAVRYFGTIPAGKQARASYRTEVEQRGPKRVKVRRPAELPSLLMMYKTPVLRKDNSGGDGAWEPYALEVLTGILSGGNSARFSSRLIRGKEVAASAGVSYNLIARMDNVLTLSGTPAQGHSIMDLEQAFLDEIKELQTNLVTDSELERVKAQVVSSDVYERDSVFYQAMVIGMLETIGLSWRLADEYVDKIAEITPEQVRKVARKYLVEDFLTVTELEPLPLDAGAQQASTGGHDNVH